ncbi:MAG: hypothetical protein KatS3mg054_0059 [Chloroflexus sp.]|nr:MAG: hypothetical protein KatS3mg054_0059 [Chloroflexus sp.]
MTLKNLLVVTALLVCMGSITYAQRTITTNNLVAKNRIVVGESAVISADSLAIIKTDYADSVDVLAIRNGNVIRFRLPVSAGAGTVDVNVADPGSKGGGLIKLATDTLGFAPWQVPQGAQWAPDSRHFFYATNFLDSTLQKYNLWAIRGSRDGVRVTNGTGGSTVEYHVTEDINLIECSGTALNGIIRIHLDTVQGKVAYNTTKELWIINNFVGSNSVVEVYYKGTEIAEFDDETSAALCTYNFSGDAWTVSEFRNPDYAPPVGTGGIYSGSGTVAAGAIADVPPGGFTLRYGNVSTVTNNGMTITGGTSPNISFDGTVQVEQLKIETSSGLTPYLQIDSVGVPQNNSPKKALTYDPVTKRVYQSNFMDTSNFVKKMGEPMQVIGGDIQIGEKQKFYDQGYRIKNLNSSAANARLFGFSDITPPVGTFDVGDKVYITGATCGSVSIPDGEYTITQEISSSEFEINYQIPGSTLCNIASATARIGNDLPADLVVADTAVFRGVVMTDLPMAPPEGDMLQYVVQDGGELKIREKSLWTVGYKFSSETTMTVTASAYYTLPVNTTSSPVTINPPATVSAGTWFAVSDSRGTAGTNPITIDFVGSSQKLHGQVQNMMINTNGGYVKFAYVDSVIGWIRVN